MSPPWKFQEIFPACLVVKKNGPKMSICALSPPWKFLKVDRYALLADSGQNKYSSSKKLVNKNGLRCRVCATLNKIRWATWKNHYENWKNNKFFVLNRNHAETSHWSQLHEVLRIFMTILVLNSSQTDAMVRHYSSECGTTYALKKE